MPKKINNPNNKDYHHQLSSGRVFSLSLRGCGFESWSGNTKAVQRGSQNQITSHLKDATVSGTSTILFSFDKEWQPHQGSPNFLSFFGCRCWELTTHLEEEKNCCFFLFSGKLIPAVFASIGIIFSYYSKKAISTTM